MVDNYKIVDEIARKGLVRKIINKITSTGKTVFDADTLQDLEQDIMLSLLQDKNLEDVYNENHINYYLARIITNNICSSTSPYYRRYVLPRKKNATLIEAISKDETGFTD